MSLSDFSIIKVIGKGAFGEVLLVKKNDTGEVLAMKKLIKEEMLKKKQTVHVRQERDILAKSDNPVSCTCISLQFFCSGSSNYFTPSKMTNTCSSVWSFFKVVIWWHGSSPRKFLPKNKHDFMLPNWYWQWNPFIKWTMCIGILFNFYIHF